MASSYVCSTAAALVASFLAFTSSSRCWVSWLVLLIIYIYTVKAIDTLVSSIIDFFVWFDLCDLIDSIVTSLAFPQATPLDFD